MESLENILKEYEKWQDRYSASYEPDTGKIISVGPLIALQKEEYKIDLDKETAEDILTGKIQIHNCFLDFDAGKIEITEIRSIRKIDDVLHRIPLENFSDIDSPDVFVRYEKIKNRLTIELSANLMGSRKTGIKKKRNIHWSGDTVMSFYLTKYNDPHWIYYQYDVKIEELKGKSKKFQKIDLPEKFSVFTRRIFKNYVLEIK